MKGGVDKRPLISYAAIVVFMAVTVAHVASYAGSFEPEGWQAVGWFYALAVDASIAICAWLTRWKTTRVMAWVGFFSFTVMSGLLNVSHVKPWQYGGWEAIGAWAYALFPTAAIALLGFLARDAELLAERSEKSKRRKAEKENKPAPEQSQAGNGSKSATCPYCEKGFATHQAVNAHLRFCSEREAERQPEPEEQH